MCQRYRRRKRQSSGFYSVLCVGKTDKVWSIRERLSVKWRGSQGLLVTSGGPQTIRMAKGESVVLGCTYEVAPFDNGKLDIEWSMRSPDTTQKDKMLELKQADLSGLCGPALRKLGVGGSCCCFSTWRGEKRFQPQKQWQWQLEVAVACSPSATMVLARQLISHSSGSTYDHAGGKEFSFLAADPSHGDASLSITRLSFAHSGTYQCKVKKSPGVDMRKISLVVMAKPSVPKCWLEGSEMVGEPVALHCDSAGGATPLSYSWSRQPSIPPAATQTWLQGYRALFLRRARFLDPPSHATRTVSGSFRVSLCRCYLLITACTGLHYGHHQRLTLQCSITSAAYMREHVTYDGNVLRKGSESGVLEISNHSLSFAGLYVCEVNNAVGAERCSINLRADKRKPLTPHGLNCVSLISGNLGGAANAAGLIMGTVVGSILLSFVLLLFVALVYWRLRTVRHSEKEFSNEIREDVPPPESRPVSRHTSRSSVRQPSVIYCPVGDKQRGRMEIRSIRSNGYIAVTSTPVPDVSTNCYAV
ncbi:coxsackievirus and adenovirus receptor homolog [Synchiropus picturatus]